MADKQTRVSEITRIYKRDGHVKASTVVKEAKPKRSLLHDEFEWDDATAAHEHRLDQARRLIRVTPVRLETGVEQRLVNVPPTVVDGPTAATNDTEGNYKPIAVVAEDENEFQRALQQMKKQFNAARRNLREMEAAVSGESTKAQLLPSLRDAFAVCKKAIDMVEHAA